MNRRKFLELALTSATALSVSPTNRDPAVASPLPSDLAAKPLSVVRRTIEVKGRAATVFGIQSPEGSGLRMRAGDAFNVLLRNQSGEPTIVHWHGLTPPWPSDGVPNAPKPLIPAGGERSFDFPVRNPGTYWMHAHTLQEQQLLAAPLIVTDPAEDRIDEQEVVVLLHDFSFKTPEELLAGLQAEGRKSAGAQPQQMVGQSGAGGMDHRNMPMAGMNSGGVPGMMHSGQMSGMTMDLNDIDYDAYLANDRTLADPQVFDVERGARIRLRIINGATATAFTVDLGTLRGMLVAVDGQPVSPVSGRQFPLSMGQRIDVRLTLPVASRAFPILFLREGATERTGIFLRPPGAIVEKAEVDGAGAGPVLDLKMEFGLRAVQPLAQRPPSKVFGLALLGNMSAYQWGLQASPEIFVSKGDRIEISMRNMTMMAHPMHLHGHHFQVVAIDGQRIAGAVRDTVLLPPMRTVTIAVDADNPGQWAFHCHHLYHMVTGMMTTFAYNV